MLIYKKLAIHESYRARKYRKLGVDKITMCHYQKITGVLIRNEESLKLNAQFPKNYLDDNHDGNFNLII